jgi:hypothetical protein
MLTSAPGALVKELHKVWVYWNLCSQLFLSIKNALFSTKITHCGILNALVSMSQVYHAFPAIIPLIFLIVQLQDII